MTDLITLIISFFIVAISLLSVIIQVIGIAASVILNPFLAGMIIITGANIYAIALGTTRKQMIINYGIYAKMVISCISYVFKLAIPIISGLMEFIGIIISGLMDTPQITVLGTGISIGTILATAILIIIAGSLLFFGITIK